MCATRFYYYPQSMVLPDQLDDLIVELKKNKAKVRAWYFLQCVILRALVLPDYLMTSLLS